jgi:hypothetical protein
MAGWNRPAYSGAVTGLFNLPGDVDFRHQRGSSLKVVGDQPFHVLDMLTEASPYQSTEEKRPSTRNANKSRFPSLYLMHRRP